MSKGTVRFIIRNQHDEISGVEIPVFVVRIFNGFRWAILDAFEDRNEMEEFHPGILHQNAD